MTQSDLFLGLDLGTTSTKAVLVDAEGALVAEASAEHPVAYPRAGWSEQSPEDWWTSSIAATHAVVALAGANASTRVAAIGLSGQMHGLVALDAQGAVLRPCILWNDSRSADICDRWMRAPGLATLLRTTGNRIFSGFQAPKLQWMKEHEPALFAATAHVLLPKDWLRYRLSGVMMGEPSDASGTGVFDCAHRTWSTELLSTLGFARSLFPDIAESPVHSSTLSSAAAHALGLRVGIGIAGGAGDQAAGAIGSGIVEEGTVSCVIGTSGVLFAPSAQWRATPHGELHAFCHAIPAKWHLMGVVLSAGGSLRWFRDHLATDAIAEASQRGVDAYDILAARAARSTPGARGLVFLPYLTGERCPIPDAHMRGGFLGLDVTHTRDDIARAVFEGITFALAGNITVLRSLGLKVNRVRLSGGGAKSPFWRQLCADAFDAEIALLETDAGAAMGAAILAAVGAGAFASVEAACAATVRERCSIMPGVDASRLARAHVKFDEATRHAQGFRH
ncbi:MAG: xylulokinase [Phycisphaerales bacterium]|nr:xylulokinase [Phycisphaerales bacterium]